MAELPDSWGLEAKTNADGKAEITGRADDGSRYRVRTCDGPQVTQKDVEELHAADREAYPNPDTRVREFIDNLVGVPPSDCNQPLLDEALSFDDSDWIEAALPVVEAGFERKSFGYSRAYARNYDQAFKKAD
jgi:hypothetical protein